MGSSSSKCPPTEEVTISSGRIIGRRFLHDSDKAVNAFQGIPFANPPIGERRFKKPEPCDTWEGVKECNAFGNRGMQVSSMYEKWKHGPVSEDCLYLNVFAPGWKSSNEKGFAVMVFIHGGAFVSDSTVKYGDTMLSKYLVTKDVIVVTTQYRLGFLGFWSTGDSSCVDNLGLWDQTRALEWVKENIEAFGGDPTNVTIMGQSAGGASVDLLSISPISRDLFHKVIPMAGNGSADWATQENAVERCREWANQKMKIDDGGDSKEFISKLRLEAATKFATSMNVKPNASVKEGIQIGPRIDGLFFPRPLAELRKEAGIKPRMVGCCQYEGLMFMIAVMGKKNRSAFESVIAMMIPESVTDFKKKRDEMLEEFMKEDDLTKSMANLFSDLFLNVSCQQFVLDWLATGHDQIYLYTFDYFNEKSWGPLGYVMPVKGATHCSEIPYILGKGLIWDFDLNEKDIEMLEKVTAAWSNFAKFGNPNGENGENPLGVEWKPATKEFPMRCISINWESTMQEEFHGGRPMRWIEYRKGL
ncbi:hypothetical protein PFISCL1PPCAC_10512 [Pristionchus fissidentatus]|uniref:Carboxylic ester hydrolase n=1 Tax=Pristionchus fissidentatus TaxID=1538716 RepID=A0AAV5VMP7_9BILA|nr:hypothetical protein PFISCL1PPCAC_10512 [Pristionchus fissidentatus]